MIFLNYISWVFDSQHYTSVVTPILPSDEIPTRTSCWVSFKINLDNTVAEALHLRVIITSAVRRHVRREPLPSVRTSACVHRRRTEGFPHDGLTDVGGDEEGDTRAQTVSFLEQLVQQQHDQTSHKQLHKHTQTHTYDLIPSCFLSTVSLYPTSEICHFIITKPVIRLDHAPWDSALFRGKTGGADFISESLQ